MTMTGRVMGRQRVIAIPAEDLQRCESEELLCSRPPGKYLAVQRHSEGSIGSVHNRRHECLKTAR